MADTASPSSNLLAHASNVYSQTGEDGILQAIFNIIPASGERWSVEFGAWDGKKFSNTCNFVLHGGWRGVFIEADPVKFKEAQRTYAGNERALCLCALVDFEGPSTLDHILAKTPLPVEFDLLSIDIDGNDYHVWDAVQRYRPKVVIIEFNPSIPHNISFIQERNLEVRHGSSLFALTELARAKGYELICATELNGIYVRRELFPLFAITDNSLDALHKDTQYITQVFQLYDGTLVWHGCKKLLWHDLPIKPEKMQVLPPHLRFFNDPELPPEKRRLVREEFPKYR